MKNFRDILPEFDEFLFERGLSFNAVVIGGAAMQLMGLTDRVTKDCDILSPKITDELKDASRAFAKLHSLSENWLNNGPESLVRDLPASWEGNLVPLYRGKCLTLLTLSRIDFIRSKLFAFLDRGIDLQDLKHLMPTREEIALVTGWLKERDGNPDWPEYVDIRLRELEKELYGDS